MKPETYEHFRRLISGTMGIQLGPERQDLLKLRVRRRMRELRLSVIEDYLQHVLSDGTGEELSQLQDSVTTNYTFFFREPEHLQSLQQHLIGRIEAGQRRFRLWSAGCSTGQEPYSIAMVVLETIRQFPGVEFDVAILAADVSERVLSCARTGEYLRATVQHVPREFVGRYLVEADLEGESYVVSPEVRRIVHFRRMNLSEHPFPMRGPFDAVFCRNVMIYFDPDVRRRLLAQFESLLAPGGLLFVGLTESVIGLVDNLIPLEPSVYRKPSSDPTQARRVPHTGVLAKAGTP
jgi:chemotaxis protein methyltransferase CheR